MQSPSREVGIAAAIALLAVVEEAPDEIAVFMRPLLYDARDWVRVGAWAAIVKVGDAYYDYAEMKAVFAEIPNLVAEDTQWMSTRGFRLDWPPITVLLEPFALIATRRILETERASDADALIKFVLDHEHLGRVGFLDALTDLLRELHRPVQFAAYKPRDWNALFDHETYGSEVKEAFFKGLEPLAVPDQNLPVEIITFPHPPVELSALWSLCKFDSRLASNMWHWSKSGQAESVAEAARAVCFIADLPLERVKFQARIFLRRLADTEHGVSHVFELPEIDHPPLEWSRARAIDIGPHKLEPLLFHSYRPAAILAAHLLDTCADPVTKLAIGKHALNEGRGLTPALGAALVCNANAEIGLALVYERLQHQDEIGLRSLYAALASDPPDFDARAILAIERGLKASDYIAVEAAEFALAYANRGHLQLLGVLEKGYEYWLTAERPTQESGLIPPTPRHILLKAIFALKPPSLDQLIALGGDLRHEVSTLARERLGERLDADAATAGQISDAILDGRLDRAALDLLLKRPILLTRDRVAQLLSCFESSSAAKREYVISLLKEPFMSQDDIITWASRLKEDEDFHIREAGHRLLRAHRVPSDQTGI